MHLVDVHVVALEVEFDTVVAGLQKRFGLPRPAAERFLKGIPRVARYQADVEQANAYKRVLSELGVRVVLRPAGSSMPPSDGVPSLPVPAHGPSGITHSMRAFASSARLANRVPRAPAVPKDLTDEHAAIDFQDDDDDDPVRSELERLIVRDSNENAREFSGLSSAPEEHRSNDRAQEPLSARPERISDGTVGVVQRQIPTDPVLTAVAADRRAMGGGTVASRSGKLMLAASLLLLGVVAMWIAQSM